MFMNRIKIVLFVRLALGIQFSKAIRHHQGWGDEYTTRNFVRLGSLDITFPDELLVDLVSTRTKVRSRKRSSKRRSSKTPKSEPIVIKDEEPTTRKVSTISPEELAIKVSDPIISEHLFTEEMTGHEFENPTTVDRLARSGLEMAMKFGPTFENRWIDWTTHKDTQKLLKEKEEWSALRDGDVLMYIGTSKVDGYGSNLPIIRTKSILPLSAEAMAQLLMDSSQVKTYNKLSVGRKDIKVLNDRTKIVCNLTKPPMTSKNMVSVTLMHSRPLGEEDVDMLGDEHKTGHLVVSRAVPPKMVDDDLKDLTRNDILLGVNVLQDFGDNQCLMTAVTHVYSPALPQMLAKKSGCVSAQNFVKDIRNACN